MDYKKYFIIPAEPEEIFAALTFKPSIELWTGSPAVFEKKENTEFSLWDDSIVGKNVAFIEGKQIDQIWFFGEGHESPVTIRLHPHKKGTSMEITQTNIPEEAYSDISNGWENVYADSLIEFYTEE
tara:strand:+ start:191 stop:568 length:378 start_codon:yes stop_codon:yes gene_type:complete